jgi:hypothetical protein
MQPMVLTVEVMLKPPSTVTIELPDQVCWLRVPSAEVPFAVDPNIVVDNPLGGRPPHPSGMLWYMSHPETNCSGP